jgi:hypothetical protein
MKLDISEGRTWAVEVGHEGIDIRVLAGMVWVTFEGDPDDHVLEAPARFASARRGKVVLYALSPVRVEVAARPSHRVGRAAHAAVG